MKHLILIILIMAVTIQGKQVVISNDTKPVLTIGIPGGALAINYTLIIEDKVVRIKPTEVKNGINK